VALLSERPEQRLASDRMKILLLGKNGQVGWELQRSLQSLGSVLALDRHGADWSDVPWFVGTKRLSRLYGDLSQPSQMADTIMALRPDVVVNAAAYTAVDKAETETELAFLVNTEAPAAIARACDQIGALLVHYSTDYVFDGCSATAYTEDSPTHPQSVYGKTKLDGENAIRAFAQRHVILRTSWVFGVHGGNFLKTILRLAQEKTSLNVVSDQWGTPTSASFIAEATASVIRSLVDKPREDSQAAKEPVLPAYGTYHLTCTGRTSWFNYAVYVLQTARLLGMTGKLRAEGVKPVPTSAYPTAAVRPSFSVMNTAKLQKDFHIRPPMWEIEAAKVLLRVRDQLQQEIRIP